jgi:hypothetical protein
MAQSCRTSLSGANTPVSPPTGVDNTYDKRRVFAETNPTLGGNENDGLVTAEGEVGVTKLTEADVIHKYAEFHAECAEDRHVTTEVVQSGTGLNREVLEKALEDQWSCDPETCFRARSGKHPDPAIVPEGSMKSRRLVLYVPRRSSHLRINQIRTVMDCHENAEATRSKDEEDLGDVSRATDRTGHPSGRYDIENHG